MVLNKLKPDMEVYDVRRNTGTSTFSKYSVWPVRIKEIDEENREVLASWNFNKPEWFPECVWSKWRLKRPE